MKKSKVLSLVMLLAMSTLCLAQEAAPQAAPAAPNAPAGGRGGRGGPGGPGGGRNFDPAEMQKRMMTMIQEKLGASADELKVITPLLQAVMEKERALRELQGRGFRRPGSEGAAEVSAVEKAIESKDNAAIKTALEALRKARAAREADVAKAKAALKEVLSLGQEAQLVTMGLLD